MSMFKNVATGDITSVFGPLHDNYLARGDQELIFDDRDAQRDPLTEPLDVPSDEPEAPDVSEASPSPSDEAPAAEVSQKSTTTSGAAGVGNPKE